MRRDVLKRSRRSSRRSARLQDKNARLGIHYRRLACELLEDRRLLSIGSYPELPGMHLVDPSVNRFDGQILYFDFDGEPDVAYDGPVTLKNIDVPAFRAPGALAGQEQAIIALVLCELQNRFAGTGLTFTVHKPHPETVCSTVFVGGDDAAFSEYGAFLGLAH